MVINPKTTYKSFLDKNQYDDSGLRVVEYFQYLIRNEGVEHKKAYMIVITSDSAFATLPEVLTVIAALQDLIDKTAKPELTAYACERPEKKQSRRAESSDKIDYGNLTEKEFAALCSTVNLYPYADYIKEGLPSEKEYRQYCDTIKIDNERGELIAEFLEHCYYRGAIICKLLHLPKYEKLVTLHRVSGALIKAGGQYKLAHFQIAGILRLVKDCKDYHEARKVIDNMRHELAQGVK